MRKVLFESSSFTEKDAFSGVGYYSKTLSEALQSKLKVDNVPGPFSKTVLNKAYRKLASYHLAPPYDGPDAPYDLVIFPNFATWPTSKAKRVATVVHDLTYLKFPGSVSSKNLGYLRRVVPKSIQVSDFIITVSETVKGELIDEFGLAPERVVVTPIPPRPGFGNSPPTEIHKKYGMPTDKYFLFIGNMEPRKNIGTLIEAYLSLPIEIKNEYSLVLGGSKGWNSEEYQSILNSAVAAGENIRHVGYIDDEDVETFYKKAHFFVFPSLYEGFGMPILEALACDTPVILSDIPVFRETLGEAGVYFNPEDPSSVANTILLFCSDDYFRVDTLYKQQGLVGHFSWQQNVDLLLYGTTASRP